MQTLLLKNVLSYFNFLLLVYLKQHYIAKELQSYKLDILTYTSLFFLLIFAVIIQVVSACSCFFG